jgi:selenocysteine lyase/cysteine desulfurase
MRFLMHTHDDIEHVNTDLQSTMARRHFLKTIGGAAGLATMVGSNSFKQVEAAVGQVTGLTPQQVARDETFWMEIQQAFSMSRSLVNLDNAWTCPSPRVVTEALVRYIWDQEQVPAQQWIPEFEERMETIRVGLARLFGAAPEEIAITRNATESLKNVLYGFPLKTGDEVLTSSLDYSSMVSTLFHRQRRDGIKVNRIDVQAPVASMDELVEMYERGITENTRLILVSHMAYLNGQVFPVKRICEVAHRRGVEVVVDGAHSFAHLAHKQQDLQGDYYGASLHKWLLAPKGTGLLFIRKDKIEKIPALMYSSRSGRRRGRITKFERIGTSSLATYLAIGEAIAFHQTIGPKRKEERLRYLTHYWAEQLQDIPKIRLYTSLDPAMSCGIATVGIEGVHPEALRDYLWNEYRVQTARIFREGRIQGLRISPNVYTMLPELDRFCELMDHVARNGLPEPYKSMTFERDF